MAPDAHAPSYKEIKESYERARKFIRLFDPLENIINMGFSRIRGMFRFRYLDLKHTLSFLEIIYLRYIEELECYKKYVLFGDKKVNQIRNIYIEGFVDIEYTDAKDH